MLKWRLIRLFTVNTLIGAFGFTSLLSASPQVFSQPIRQHFMLQPIEVNNSIAPDVAYAIRRNTLMSVKNLIEAEIKRACLDGISVSGVFVGSGILMSVAFGDEIFLPGLAWKTWKSSAGLSFLGFRPMLTDHKPTIEQDGESYYVRYEGLSYPIALQVESVDGHVSLAHEVIIEHLTNSSAKIETLDLWTTKQRRTATYTIQHLEATRPHLEDPAKYLKEIISVLFYSSRNFAFASERR